MTTTRADKVNTKSETMYTLQLENEQQSEISTEPRHKNTVNERSYMNNQSFVCPFKEQSPLFRKNNRRGIM